MPGVQQARMYPRSRRYRARRGSHRSNAAPAHQRRNGAPTGGRPRPERCCMHHTWVWLVRLMYADAACSGKLLDRHKWARGQLAPGRCTVWANGAGNGAVAGAAKLGCASPANVPGACDREVVRATVDSTAHTSGRHKRRAPGNFSLDLAAAPHKARMGTTQREAHQTCACARVHSRRMVRRDRGTREEPADSAPKHSWAALPAPCLTEVKRTPPRQRLGKVSAGWAGQQRTGVTSQTLEQPPPARRAHRSLVLAPTEVEYKCLRQAPSAILQRLG